MSVEKVAEMLKKVSEDKGFAEKFSKVYDGGEDFTAVVAFGKENGFEFTAEDCKQVYEAIDDQMDDELSDDDLENVAGGIVSSTAAAVVGAGAAVVGAGTAVAANCKA